MNLWHSREFSPRTRRCFCPKDSRETLERVFSAYAEVFLVILLLFYCAISFLRVRGGVSDLVGFGLEVYLFSPRTRRCFYLLPFGYSRHGVFSAYAEVFLIIELGSFFK